MIGHRLSNDLSEGRKHILQTNQGFACLTTCIRRSITNSSGFPSRDKRNAMPAFERRGLVAPERPRGNIAVLFRPIVAGENDQGVIDQFFARIARIVIGLQPVNHTPQSDVVLINVVISSIGGFSIFGTSRANDRYAGYRYIRRMGRMIGIRRVIQKERALLACRTTQHD